jgi:hypothetical protein
MRFVPIHLTIFAILTLVPSGHLNADTGAIVDPPVVLHIQGADSPDGKRIIAKLNAIIIPKADFDKFPIALVVDFLTIKSKELDPDHMGLQFRLELPPTPDSKALLPHREVSITLTDTSILDVLGYVCVQTELRFKIVKGEVVLCPGRLYQPPLSEPTIKR